MSTKRLTKSRSSFINPGLSQPVNESVIFDGWRSFSSDSQQHHVLVIDHSSAAIIEIVVFNESLNIEAPRIYLNRDILTSSFSDGNVLEKFSDIRKTLVRQKEIVQILKYINARLTVPAYTVPLEFAAVLYLKANDTVSPVIPYEVMRNNKSPDFVPLETRRPRNETFLEANFAATLIDWQKECTAMSAANQRSHAYEETARAAIDGFKRRGPLKRANSMRCATNSGVAKPLTVARSRWVSTVQKVQTANFAKKVNNRLALSLETTLGSSASEEEVEAEVDKHYEEMVEDHDENVAFYEANATPKNEDFYHKLLRFHYELPLLAASADRAAYLEELAASVIGLFRTNLEQHKRSALSLERLSPARQRWLRAFRKVCARNHTLALRRRLERSPPALRSAGAEVSVKEAEAGLDAALAHRVSVLLGPNWLSCELTFYELLNKLNREIRCLSAQSKRAAYLEGLTAAVVAQFRQHLARLQRSKSDHARGESAAKQRWRRALARVRAQRHTAAVRLRLSTSSVAKPLLGGAKHARQMALIVGKKKEQEQRDSPSRTPTSKRHARRDDVVIRNMPKGYAPVQQLLTTSASTSGAGLSSGGGGGGGGGTATSPVSRGVEKSYSEDNALVHFRSTRKSLPARLQRQMGLGSGSGSGSASGSGGRVSERRPPCLSEGMGQQQSKSLRSSSMRMKPTAQNMGKLAKSNSASEVCGGDVSDTYSTVGVDGVAATERADLDGIEGGAGGGGNPTLTSHKSMSNTLLQRLVDPFSRSSKTPRGAAAASGSGCSSPGGSGDYTHLSAQAQARGGGAKLETAASGDVLTDRDSFDTQDYATPGGGGGGDSSQQQSGTNTPRHSMSPSLLYQRLVASTSGGSGPAALLPPQRSRTTSDNESTSGVTFVAPLDDIGSASPPMKVHTKGSPGGGGGGGARFSILRGGGAGSGSGSGHVNRVVPVLAFDMPITDTKPLVVAGAGGAFNSHSSNNHYGNGSSLFHNSTSMDSDDCHGASLYRSSSNDYYHDSTHSGGGGGYAAAHHGFDSSSSHRVLKVSTLDSYDGTVQQAQQHQSQRDGHNPRSGGVKNNGWMTSSHAATKQQPSHPSPYQRPATTTASSSSSSHHVHDHFHAYFVEESPSAVSELISPLEEMHVHGRHRVTTAAPAALSNSSSSSSSVYFSKSGPNSPDVRKLAEKKSMTPHAGGAATPPSLRAPAQRQRSLTSSPSVRNMGAVSGVSSPSGLAPKKYDTTHGDLTRKYNLDGTTKEVSGPRYAQSTLQSAIRGTSAQNDKIL